MSRSALVVLLAFNWAVPAHAACTALPVLSALTQEVDTLTSLTQSDAIKRSGRSIATRRIALIKLKVFSRLSAVGFERKLRDVMNFKAQLGELSQITQKGDAGAVATYTSTASFRRSYNTASTLVSELCIAPGGQSQTDAASKVFELNAGRQTAQLFSFGGHKTVFSLLAMSAVLLMGVLLASNWRRRIAKRERRRNKRVPCDIPVLVNVFGQTLMYRLVDISRSGANMENDMDLAVGSKLALTFGRQKKNCTVTWSNRQFTGVHFEKAFTKKELIQTIEETCTLHTDQNEKRDAVSSVAQIS